MLYYCYMRHDQYQPIKALDAMAIFHSLPRELRQDILVKAEKFKERANEGLAAGEKNGMRIRDAVIVVITVLNYEPLWRKKDEHK